MSELINTQDQDFIYPDWPAPAHVKSVMTTRKGGVSRTTFDSMNLGTHVDDSSEAVTQNRAILKQKLALPNEPLWLNQIHGTTVAQHNTDKQGCDADAVVSHQANEVCAIMTADCLPVLFCNREGTVVAGAHAGWRGLQSGVLETTIASMQCETDEILVWLGAAIGPANFEVGDEVREAFVSVHEISATAFIRNPNNGKKWLADLYQLAKIHLETSGVVVENIYGGGRCTYQESDLFYSYRRESRTGRMASLIWLT